MAGVHRVTAVGRAAVAMVAIAALCIERKARMLPETVRRDAGASKQNARNRFR